MFDSSVIYNISVFSHVNISSSLWFKDRSIQVIITKSLVGNCQKFSEYRQFDGIMIKGPRTTCTYGIL